MTSKPILNAYKQHLTTSSSSLKAMNPSQLVHKQRIHTFYHQHDIKNKGSTVAVM